MQQYKEWFKNKDIKNETVCNIQPCIRLTDLDEIGDGTHLLYFNMIGMFSFRHLSLKETIDFWTSFIKKIGLKLDYVTIHPDKFEEWKNFYDDVEIRKDEECKWSSDGNDWSYCTEFYINDIEIGNIVNNGGDSIDVGFGYERLDSLVNGTSKNEIDILKETILKIIESGYKPSPNNQGYVLRKLLKMLVDSNEILDHEYFYKEKERQIKIKERYERLKTKHKDKSKQWWYETHGIDLDLIK